MDIGETVWNIRPVDKLILKDRCATRLLQQGLFQITGYSGLDNAQPEKDMQEAALSFRAVASLSDPGAETPTFFRNDRSSDSGIYWIVDLREETAGQA